MNRLMQTHIMPAPRAVGIFPSRAPLLETTTEKARFAAANTLASSKFYSFLRKRYELTGVLTDALTQIYSAYFDKGSLSFDNLHGNNFKSHVVRCAHASSRIIYEISISRANSPASLLLDITSPSRPGFVFIGVPADAACFLSLASEKEIGNASEQGYNETFAKTK